MTRKSKRRWSRQVPAWLLAGGMTGPFAVDVSQAQTSAEEPTRASSAPDRQFRGQLAISAPLYRGVRLTLDTDLRLSRGIPDDRFARGEIGLIYAHRLNPHLVLVPRYRYRATDEFGGPTEREHRFSLSGDLRFAIGSVTVTDRNLVEFRRRGRGGETRYRNRLQLEHPVLLGGHEAALFISNEAFYDANDRDWTRNRFRIGVIRPLSKQVEVELHYLRQWDKFDEPGKIDAIALEVEITLEEM